MLTMAAHLLQAGDSGSLPPGAPLAFVRIGDTVTLDVPNRVVRIHVDDTELDRRRQSWTAPLVPGSDRPWTRLYVEHVLQADEGCDLDFLQGRIGVSVGPRAF